MNHPSQHQAAMPGHEPIEADVRRAWLAGVIIAGVVVAAFLAVVWLMKWFGTTIGGLPPRPLAITNPHWNVAPKAQQLRTREHELLNTFQWVDRSAGVARIPIDRALELIAENGLPPAIGASTNPSAPTAKER